jgi:hypothetical protein
MSRTYTPDSWVLVRVGDGEDVGYKVLASWYGSYTHGASWKLSSGINGLDKTSNCYNFHNYSGSHYLCGFGSYGTSSYTELVFSNLRQQFSRNLTILTQEEAIAILDNMEFV